MKSKRVIPAGSLEDEPAVKRLRTRAPVGGEGSGVAGTEASSAFSSPASSTGGATDWAMSDFTATSTSSSPGTQLLQQQPPTYTRGWSCTLDALGQCISGVHLAEQYLAESEASAPSMMVSPLPCARSSESLALPARSPLPARSASAMSLRRTKMAHHRRLGSASTAMPESRRLRSAGLPPAPGNSTPHLPPLVSPSPVHDADDMDLANTVSSATRRLDDERPLDLINRKRRDPNQMSIERDENSVLTDDGEDSSDNDDAPPAMSHVVALSPALLVSVAPLVPPTPLSAAEIPSTGVFSDFVRYVKANSPSAVNIALPPAAMSNPHMPTRAPTHAWPQ